MLEMDISDTRPGRFMVITEVTLGVPLSEMATGSLWVTGAMQFAVVNDRLEVKGVTPQRVVALTRQ